MNPIDISKKAAAGAPVLVLDANSRAGIAFIRSLGRAGLRVVAAECHPKAAGFYSRFCSEGIVYRSPLRDRQGFIEDVLAELRRAKYSALFAMTDQTILSLAERREEVSALVPCSLPLAGQVDGVFDKKRTLEIADSLGIRIPSTVEPRSSIDAVEIAQELSYPVVVKTRRSTAWEGDEGAKKKPAYAFGPEELLVHVRNLTRAGSPPLLQEFIPGAERGFATFVRGGRQIATFELERLRSTHPLGSGSWCCSRAVAHDPYVSRAAESLLAALGWEGFALVEFKVHARTGEAYLLEINGRPWASLHLAVKAGVDFPLLAYQVLTGEGEPQPAGQYILGTQCRWLRGELMYLRHILGGTPVGSRVAYPGRLKGTAEVLGRGVVSEAEEFMFADPRPGVVALWRHLTAGAGRGLRRLAGIGGRVSRGRARKVFGRVAAAAWICWVIAIYARYFLGYKQLIKRAAVLLMG